MSAPEISVVMSVYNNADTLPAALDSILSQEGVALELIVIDDGSTDGSGKILDDVAEQDSRLIVIHKKNEGLTRALIEGCEMSSAPWIARQDADDISLSGRLRKQMEFVGANSEVVLCSVGVRVLAPDGEIFDEVISNGSLDVLTDRLREKMVGIPAHGSTIFNRAAYQKAGGYRGSFYFAQDADLWLRLGLLGKVGSLPDILYEFSMTVEGISSSYRDVQAEFCRLARKAYSERRAGASESAVLQQVDELRIRLLESMKNSKDSSRSSKIRAAQAYRMIAAGVRRRKNAEASRKYLKRALRIDPLSPSIWFDLFRSIS